MTKLFNPGTKKNRMMGLTARTLEKGTKREKERERGRMKYTYAKKRTRGLCVKEIIIFRKIE